MSDTSPEVAFAEALAKFQGELPHVKKGQTATVPTKAGGKYSYDYADLTDITEVAVPVLTKCGLSWTAKPTVTEAGFVLRYSLLHTGGHRETGDYPLPDPARSSPQEIGSALTYARRYALTAVTGIAPGGDDDDGQKASDARAADPLPRAARRPNATTRSGPPADPSQVTDEWTTPEPKRATDLAWLEDIRRRLVGCESPSRVRGLREEANVVWAERRLADDDAKALKAEMAEREAELKGESQEALV